MDHPPQADRRAHPEPGGRSLRRRIRTGILAVTALAVLLFAVPLGVAVDRLYRSQELATLQAAATRVAALLPDNAVRPGIAFAVPRLRDVDATVGVYTTAGALAAGTGPAMSGLARAGRDGQVHRGAEHAQWVVVVPVSSDREVVAVVRAAATTAATASRAHQGWAAMALLGLAVIGVATMLAERQARRIARPLERLTAAAQALGGGDFAIAAEHTGLREADAASAALADTAARLGRLLERERAFSADASHQLRTPLTGLLLGLESSLDQPGGDLLVATRTALERGRRLQMTIDDLLALRRDVDRRPESLDVAVALSGAKDRWQAQTPSGRRIQVSTEPGCAPVAVSAAALRQILDVLLANALAHGDGTVTLTGEDIGDVVALAVTDEGTGLFGDPEAAFRRRPDGSGDHGIGLALARSLAEAEGGRLVVRRAAPRPVFALLLPAVRTVVAGGSAAAGQLSNS